MDRRAAVSAIVGVAAFAAAGCAADACGVDANIRMKKRDEEIRLYEIRDDEYAPARYIAFIRDGSGNTITSGFYSTEEAVHHWLKRHKQGKTIQ